MDRAIDCGRILVAKFVHHLGQVRGEEANRGETDENDPRCVEHSRLVVLAKDKRKVRGRHCAVDDEHRVLLN